MFKLPRLLPKADRFCTLLEDLAQQAGACAYHLKTFVESTDAAERARAGAAITESRNKAKELAAAVTEELCRSFITPFDREDIQDFSAELYKIPKTIEKVKERLELHDLTLSQGDFLRQIMVIVQEAEVMGEMVKGLVSGQSSHDVQAGISRLYDLEHKGDTVLNELLGSLFREHTDARDLILRKDIYDMLEKIIDRYRDAAGIALQMVLKHT